MKKEDNEKSSKVDKMKQTLIKNIQTFLERKRIGQTDMARDLGFPESTVSNWMQGETYPRPDKLQAMADYFGVRRSDLTEEQPTNLIEISPRTVRIPVLGKIACGDPILAEENIEGYRYEFADNLPSGELFILEAKGKSMQPTVPDGCFVMIRQQNEVENGEIAAVLINGNDEATLKRVKRQGDIVMLMPDNNEFEPIIVTKENPITILGKAIRFTVDL